jgi:hypothetical protein
MLEKSGRKGTSTWMSSAAFGSGLARMRVTTGKGMRAALVIRGRASGGGLISGYRFRVARGRAYLERIDRGKATSIARSKAIRVRGEVEFILAGYGDWIIGRAFDVKRGRHLGTLVAQDTTHGRGRVGLQAERKHKAKARFSHLSYRAACRAIPGHTSGAPPLFVTAAASDLSTVKYREMEAVSGSIVGRISLPTVERLFCEKKTLKKLSALVPYKYMGKRYLKQRRQLARRPVKIPLDKNGAPALSLSVKNPSMVQAYLAEYHRRHPKKTRMGWLRGGRRKGRTHEGRRIPYLVVGDHANSPDVSVPSFLIIGAHHGNEPMSVDFVLDSIHRTLEVSDSRSRRWLRRVNIWFIPVTNPDGLRRFLEVSRAMGRKNGREQDRWKGPTGGDGVDLNRNYPFRWHTLGEKGSKSSKAHPWYRGPSPASEPETQAIMALSNEEHFAGLLTYHGGTVALLAPYTIDNVENPTRNEAWDVAEDLVAGLPDHPQGKEWIVRKNLYSVDGTDQDWHRFAHGTVALLVEGARRTPKTSRQHRAVRLSARPLFERLIDRFLDGPSVSGFVVDKDGNPLQAIVDIVEVGTRAGETWRSRCRDGRFDRYLPKGITTANLVVRSDAGELHRVTVSGLPGQEPTRIVIENPSADIRCP